MNSLDHENNLIKEHIVALVRVTTELLAQFEAFFVSPNLDHDLVAFGERCKTISHFYELIADECFILAYLRGEENGDRP